jgi:tripartite-type tricarboxylate transporter receptor subunit TctC
MHITESSTIMIVRPINQLLRQVVAAVPCLTCVMTVNAAALPGGDAARYPNRRVRLMCPFPPGGGADLVTRTLGEKFFERTGQPFITDNRGGASGAIGTTIAAKAAPDGYTVLVASSNALAVNPALQGQTHKDILRDFAAILRLPDVRKRLSQEAAGSTPEQLSTQIEREIEKWTKIVKAANIRPDQ